MENRAVFVGILVTAVMMLVAVGATTMMVQHANASKWSGWYCGPIVGGCVGGSHQSDPWDNNNNGGGGGDDGGDNGGSDDN